VPTDRSEALAAVLCKVYCKRVDILRVDTFESTLSSFGHIFCKIFHTGLTTVCRREQWMRTLVSLCESRLVARDTTLHECEGQSNSRSPMNNYKLFPRKPDPALQISSGISKPLRGPRLIPVYDETTAIETMPELYRGVLFWLAEGEGARCASGGRGTG
jgi:hypothetical protein